MKKALFILIPSFILAIAIFLSVQFFVLQYFVKGALQVTSLPDSKVYLNGVYLGKTPLCRCTRKDMLPVGTQQQLKLVPDDSSFPAYMEIIPITNSVLTVVDHTFGKTATSEGSTITLSPLVDKTATQLVVVTLPDKAEVTLDKSVLGESPVTTNKVQVTDHLLRIKKQGFKEKLVRIRQPKGYKLTATVYLGFDEDAAQPSVTPTPTPQAAQVKILDTPVGFLRVRSDASLNSDEIAKVSPGDTYELVQEENGWYEIKLKNGTTGWIDAQYAQKQ